MAIQNKWSFCHKCNAMFYDGDQHNKGRCPQGGAHDMQGFDFTLPFALPETPHAQSNWRFCGKCSGLVYTGYPTKGVCPADKGPHVSPQGSFVFTLPYGLPETPTAQANWNYCGKCMTMFYNGFPTKGVCPAAGAHVASGLNFTLPHDLPYSRTFDFNSITFDGGTTVGGNAHLSVNEAGGYTFSGHFHDSGAPDYNVKIVVGLKDSQNKVYTFAHSARIFGTFDSGSRNADWKISGVNPQIADNWAAIATSAQAIARSSTSVDVVALVYDITSYFADVLEVVAIVAAAA
jgi:hypothetical protein